MVTSRGSARPQNPNCCDAVLLSGLHPCVVRDPVNFPSLTAVIGERLFEVTGIRGNVGNDEAHQDGAAIQSFLIVELAAAIPEFPDGRHADRPGPAIGEVEAPLVRLRIVKAQVETLEMASWAIGNQFHEVSATVPHLAHHRHAVVINPRRGTGERMEQTPQVRLPGADLEVKVMLTVAELERRSLQGARVL